MRQEPPNHHATALALGEAGVLIRGAARSGKSSLAFSALRRAALLAVPARLVADDQVLLAAERGALIARAPRATLGLIEISGVGILNEPAIESVRLALVVDLREAGDIERLPRDDDSVVLEGVRLRRIALPARQAAFGADILHGLLMSAAPAAGPPSTGFC